MTAVTYWLSFRTQREIYPIHFCGMVTKLNYTANLTIFLGGCYQAEVLAKHVSQYIFRNATRRSAQEQGGSMSQQAKIIDGDGHIFEDSDGIARHFPYSATGGRLRSGVFPLNSHIQYSLTRTPPGAFATTAEGRFRNPGPEGWIEFMEQVGYRLRGALSHCRPTHRPHRRPRLRLRRVARLQRLAGRDLFPARFALQRRRPDTDA